MMRCRHAEQEGWQVFRVLATYRCKYFHYYFLNSFSSYTIHSLLHYLTAKIIIIKKKKHHHIAAPHILYIILYSGAEGRLTDNFPVLRLVAVRRRRQQQIPKSDVHYTYNIYIYVHKYP